MGKKGKKSFKGGVGKSKPSKRRRAKQFIDRVVPPEAVFTQSLMEFLNEYQTKYTNLFKLSEEYNHKLLDAIACEIYQRLTHLINGFQGMLANYNFTRQYRRTYPHCDDLKFIQEKMWEVNKQLGQPLRDIDLETLTKHSTVENPLTIAELLGSSSRILTPLAIKITSHINNLNTSESGPNKVIREALKKQTGSIHEILTKTIEETVMPETKNKLMGKMKIYGEPYLPSTQVLQSLIAKFRPTEQMMSRRVFNCFLLSVAVDQIEPLLKIDGTVVDNVKLVVCRSIQPEYRLPAFVVQKIKEFFGIAAVAPASDINSDEEVGEKEGEQSGDSDV